MQSGYRVFYEDENMATQSIRSNGWSHSKEMEAALKFTAYGWEENVLNVDQSETYRACSEVYTEMHLQFCKAISWAVQKQQYRYHSEKHKPFVYEK